MCVCSLKKNVLYSRNSCAVDSPIRFEEQNNVVTNKNKISGAIFCLQQLKCKKKKKPKSLPSLKFNPFNILAIEIKVAI